MNTNAEIYNEILSMIENQSSCEELMAKKINMSWKRYGLMKKFGLTKEDFVLQTYRKEDKLYFKENIVFHLNSRDVFSVDVLEIENDNMLLIGRTNLSYYKDRFDIYAVENISGKKYSVAMKPCPAFDQYTDEGESVFVSYQFEFKLPLNNGNSYSFFITEKESSWKKSLRLSFKDFAKLNENLIHSYFCDNRWIVKLRKNNLYVLKDSIIERTKCEVKLLYEYARKSFSGKAQCLSVCKYRLVAQLQRAMAKKEVWLISDRPNVAGDNGEAFFEYVTSKTEVKAYFLLDKNCNDYSRLKRIGRVVSYGSFRHKILFLAADKIVSASADDWVFNIMGEKGSYVKDLYKFDYVFLQHGVIQKNFSSWLHKCKKNIKVFVTTANDEYVSIVDGGYGYENSEVVLTGLPRYDKLKNDPTKKIAIMPTWRRSIAADHVPLASNPNIMVRGYSERFKDTEYYKMYQGLLNDARFIEALNRYGYVCDFYLHNSFARQSVDFFSVDDRVRICSGSINYSKVFAESSLLVTDYSSTAIDFAYLKKPIAYFQFDLLTFLNEHTGKEGYFDFEEKGFGPVCKTIDHIVDELIRYMEKECVMSDKYKQRVDDFFKYNDTQNCERVYASIRALPKRKGK